MEHKFLLVHRRRGLQRRFDPLPEPGLVRPVLRYLRKGFALPHAALRFAVSEGNDHAQGFALRDELPHLPLVEGQRRPAGVQAELLGKKDHLFPVESLWRESVTIHAPRRVLRRSTTI